MKALFSLGLVALLSMGQFSNAQQMDVEDKKKLIKELNQLLNSSLSAEAKILNMAIAKLSAAGRDPGAAYDLFVKSKELTVEQEKEKNKTRGRSAKASNQAMKEWREREAKKYQDRNVRKGLMLQFQWTALVLKARLKENQLKSTSTNDEETINLTEFQKPALDLLTAFTSACSDPNFVRAEYGSIAGANIAVRSTFSSEVGQALGIDGLECQSFPSTMTNRKEIFDKLFFAEYKKTLNASGLRTAWNKLISLEINNQKVHSVLETGKRSGIQGRIANASEDSFDENATNYIATLRWQCEVDCFELGDQFVSTQNMMKLIKSSRNPSQREQMIRSLKNILVKSLAAPEQETDNASQGEPDIEGDRLDEPTHTAKPTKKKSDVDFFDDM